MFKYAHLKNYPLIYGDVQCFVLAFWRPIVLAGKTYDVAAIHQYLPGYFYTLFVQGGGGIHSFIVYFCIERHKTH